MTTDLDVTLTRSHKRDPQYPLADPLSFVSDESFWFDHTTVADVVSQALCGSFANRSATQGLLGGIWSKAVVATQGPLESGTSETVRFSKRHTAFTPNEGLAIAPMFDIEQKLVSCLPASAAGGASAVIVSTFIKTTDVAAARSVVHASLHPTSGGRVVSLVEVGPLLCETLESEPVPDRTAINWVKALMADYKLRRWFGQSDESIEEVFAERLAAFRMAIGAAGDSVWTITQEDDLVRIRETMGVDRTTTFQTENWRPVSSALPGRIFLPRHQALLEDVMTKQLPLQLTARNQARAAGTLDPVCDPGSCAQ